MESLTVGQAAARTGWSPRMLRYLERAGLPAVRPARAQPAAFPRRTSPPLRRRDRRARVHGTVAAGAGPPGRRRDVARRDTALCPRLGAAQARTPARRL